VGEITTEIRHSQGFETKEELKKKREELLDILNQLKSIATSQAA